MANKQTMKTIQWTEKRLQQIKLTIKMLEQAIDDYLQWMATNGYANSTREKNKQMLNSFLSFIRCRRFNWDEIFTLDTLKLFQKVRRIKHVHAITGLARYLFEHKRIRHPIQKQCQLLPDIYEQYLIYYKKSRQASRRKIKQIRRVLVSFNNYLKKSDIKLSAIKIEHIDAFMAEFNTRFSSQTCRVYRSYLRGFLKYLYMERRILSRDLAPLVVGAPMFAKAKPPKFLRPKEVKEVFDSLKLSSSMDIRTCAMVHLAYTLGLRPKEINRISLDDISFKSAELTIKVRKNDNPIKLPLPDITIKAIAAYMIGVRPLSKHRTLFLSLQVPHGPLCQGVVGQYISKCMKTVNPYSTAYWLRHTYAQNLLEAGVSIYEIKEMLGHYSIEATRKYLHIHIKLMRKVLFDEEL